jgi:hypothetical protein
MTLTIPGNTAQSLPVSGIHPDRKGDDAPESGP